MYIIFRAFHGIGIGQDFTRFTRYTNAISVYTIRYDTIEEFNVTRKLSIQLYLAHVARKKYIKRLKKETKTNKRQCPFTLLQEGSPGGICLRMTTEERICKRDEF